MMRALILAGLLATAACSDVSSGGPVVPVAETGTVTHDFGEYSLEAAEEVASKCVQWTLGNEEPIYVNAVTLSNRGAYHHSNWFVVPEDKYPGPDGYFRCSSRGFDEVASAVAGTVIFAQSTQSQIEEQKFAAGAVIKVPPHHKVVAGVHMLNPTARPMTTELRMSLGLVHPRDVKVVLAPFRLSYVDLHIPARSEAHFTTDCDLASAYEELAGKPFDIKLYWVLPHYHYLGNYFRVSVIGGPHDGEVIHGIDTFDAEANGKALDPPLDLTGARGLRLTCGFGNPRDVEVGWGIGDQEMCVMLGFADSAVLMDGSGGSNRVVGVENGIVQNVGTCGKIGIPKNEAQTMPTAAEVAAPLYVPASEAGGDLTPAIECADDPGGVLPEPPTTLSSIDETVFRGTCTYSACHDSQAPAAGLDLSQDLHANLLGHRVVMARTSMPLVRPGDPDGSWLMQLISKCEPRDDAGTVHAHMPRNAQTLLDPAVVAKIRAWIAAGAKND